MTDYRTLLETIALELFREQHRAIPESAVRNAPSSQLRQFIRQSLTSRSAFHPNETLFELVDTLLRLEAARRVVLKPRDIPTIASAKQPLGKIALYEGDITALEIDVIVNAANTAMLGCFQPTHRCIDNIIHDHAGPRLRAACTETKPDRDGDRLPTGRTILTRGFSLPAKYVAHTVGPQLDRGTLPTQQDAQLLAACYTSALDATLATLGNDKPVTIAFPCISTGLFGYPAHLAVPVAVEAVVGWLQAHESLDWKVIFNTFLATDTKLYQNHFRTLGDLDALPEPVRLPSPLETAAKLIQEADFLLISAGAGLSAAAGLDYTSEEVFAKHHMPMVRQGYSTMYEFIGHTDWSPELQWGYLFAQTKLARFNWQPTTDVYTSLKQIFNAKPESSVFVQTTNADGMFEQQGFPTSHIFTVQGDYSRIQCLKPCSGSSVWDIRPFMDKGLACQDPDTYELQDKSAIPKCPRCGGEMFLNVRGGNWFIELKEQEKAFHSWLANALDAVENHNKKLVVLEIGAGFNTPGVLRYPNEQLAESSRVSLIRLNQQHEEIPFESNGVELRQDAAPALFALSTSIKTQN